MLKKPLVMVALLASVMFGGVTLSVLSRIMQHANQAPAANQLSALTKWGNAPVPTEGWADAVSLYDFVAYTPGVWELDSMKDARTMLLTRNPDIMLGSYFQMHTAPLWMQESYNKTGTDTYVGRLWAAASPYLAQTTEGDTVSIWLNNPTYDIFNPECRTAVICELDRYVREQNLDWLFMDFVSVPLPNLKAFQAPIYEELELGDLDFDRDGIGHWDDPDEQEALKTVWFEYVTEMRETLPSNVLLIPNGTLAIRDAEFASYVDGCYIEKFAQFFFGSLNSNMFNALDPRYPVSLHHLTAKGRYFREPAFVMIGNHYRAPKWEFLASLFGVVEADMQISDTIVPKPVELGLGAPLSTVVQDSVGADSYRLSRSFEHGELSVWVHRPYFYPILIR